MMKNVLYCLLLLVWQARPSSAQTKAIGYVFHDADSDGKKGNKEKGIARVAVSNGRQVVLTDDKGKYELPITDNTIIFVVKPAGYRVPLNSNNLPRCYYIHKPKGS